jgi:hypothetical protein
MSKRHKVKTHHWNGGILQVLEHWFDSFEDAIFHGNNSGAHSVKIYAEDGDLVHSGTPPEPGSTYA